MTDSTLGSAVTVEASGTAGIFKYVVLSARDSKALKDWLDSHQYSVPPGAAEVLERYVRAGWYWLAMRVRPDKAEQPTLTPHPIVYSYRANSLTYPLAISRLSAAAETEVVLYVLARTRWRCANWANMTLRELTARGKLSEMILGRRLVADDESPSGTNYETLFSAETSRRQGRLFVTEFADSLHKPHYYHPQDQDLLRKMRKIGGPKLPEPLYLTRLRAVIPRSAMDRDVELVAMGARAPTVDREFELYVSMETTSQAAVAMIPPLSALALLCTGATLTRRRRRCGRVTGAVLIAVACTILTMI